MNISELEEGGTFDDETLPEWIRSMKAAATNASAPQYPVPGGDPGAAHLLPPPGLPAGLPGHPGHPADLVPGLPPPFAPPGLPAGLIAGQVPGAPLLGAPAPGNILLRPGFPPAGAPIVTGPPPGFPGFDSSQPPPVRLPGVLGVPPGILPPGARPPGPAGLLGPPPEVGAAPMDLEENDERRRDRDNKSRDRGHREDRRSSGRWQDDRGGRHRDDERGSRRESRWGRDDRSEDVSNRLQNMAADAPVSLLDMPDIQNPDNHGAGES